MKKKYKVGTASIVGPDKYKPCPNSLYWIVQEEKPVIHTLDLYEAFEAMHEADGTGKGYKTDRGD